MGLLLTINPTRNGEQVRGFLGVNERNLDDLAITLPETNSKFAPENGWLKDAISFLGWPIFRGKLLILGSVHLYLLQFPLQNEGGWGLFQGIIL